MKHLTDGLTDLLLLRRRRCLLLMVFCVVDLQLQLRLDNWTGIRDDF